MSVKTFSVAAGVAMVFSMAINSNAYAGSGKNVQIHNLTSSNIEYVFIVPSSNGYWGSDRMGENVIRPQYTYIFDTDYYGSGCIFDIKVVYDNDAVQYLYGVNTCRIAHIDANPGGLVVAY